MTSPSYISILSYHRSFKCLPALWVHSCHMIKFTLFADKMHDPKDKRMVKYEMWITAVCRDWCFDVVYFIYAFWNMASHCPTVTNTNSWNLWPAELTHKTQHIIQREGEGGFPATGRGRWTLPAWHCLIHFADPGMTLRLWRIGVYFLSRNLSANYINLTCTCCHVISSRLSWEMHRK